MKFKILIVEDNETIAFNLKLLLEMNNYEIILANNGKEALELMKSELNAPDLILSDIMMPIMDGYTFYKEISQHESWSSIPFIFLSAKSSPQDIRFGKILGVDDYITKPFKEEDLIASIMGKLKHSKKLREFTKKYEETARKASLIKQLDEKRELNSRNNENIRKSTYILILMWDDVIGPYLKDFYPKDPKPEIPLENISQQLYNTSTAIYGFHDFTEAQDIKLRIANINMDGFIFFDSIKDEKFRSGSSIFMIGLISPHIHYLASQRIRDNFEKLSSEVKEEKDPKLEDYWDVIVKIL